jgi:hypothetical protein
MLHENKLAFDIFYISKNVSVNGAWIQLVSATKVEEER